MANICNTIANIRCILFGKTAKNKTRISNQLFDIDASAFYIYRKSTTTLRNITLLIIYLFFINAALAQETVERSHKINAHIAEKLTVLKSDKSTRQGLYQMIYDKTYALANGRFDNDIKIGTWHFYAPNGRLLQNYDYTKKELLYEAPEDTTSNLRYFVDKQLADTDRTTKPIKIGGRYYGYLPYLKLFRLPQALMDISREASIGVVELLVSPGGRLAYFKVTIYSGNFSKTFNINVNVLNEEDKVFTPATLNGEPISCRILIKCFIDDDGTLTF